MKSRGLSTVRPHYLLTTTIIIPSLNFFALSTFLSTLRTMLSTLDAHYQHPVAPPGEVHMDDNSMQYELNLAERGDNTSGSFYAPAPSDAPFVNPPADWAANTPPSIDRSGTASPIDWDVVDASMVFELPPDDTAPIDLVHHQAVPAQLPVSSSDAADLLEVLMGLRHQSTPGVDTHSLQQRQFVNPADLQKIPPGVAHPYPFADAQQQAAEQMDYEDLDQQQMYTNVDAQYAAFNQQPSEFVDSRQQSQYQPVHSEQGYPAPTLYQPFHDSQMQGYPDSANQSNHFVDAQSMYPVYNSQQQVHFPLHQQQSLQSAGPPRGMISFSPGPSGQFLDESLGVTQQRARLQPKPQYTPFGQLPQPQATFIQEAGVRSITDDRDFFEFSDERRQASRRNRRGRGVKNNRLFSKSKTEGDGFVVCTVNRPPSPPPIASTSRHNADSDGGKLVLAKRPHSPESGSQGRKTKKIKLTPRQYDAVKRMIELTPERPSMSFCEVKTIRSSTSISDDNFFLKLPLEERMQIEEELGTKWVDHQEDLTNKDVVWLTSLTMVTDPEKFEEKYPGVDPEYFFAITEMPERFLCPYCPADRPFMLNSIDEVTAHGKEKHAIGNTPWRSIIDNGVAKELHVFHFQRSVRRKVQKAYCPYCWEQLSAMDTFGRHLLQYCQKFERLLRSGKLDLEQYDDEEGGMFNEVDERYCDEYVNQECREESAKTELPFLSDLLAKHGLC